MCVAIAIRDNTQASKQEEMVKVLITGGTFVLQ